eukprot:15340656-Ditylum_brightwellii.AAC.1
MDNLSYAATTSNNVLGQLTDTNTKLTQQLANAMKIIAQLQDENAKLLKIVEVSACACTGTVIVPAGRGTSSGKNCFNWKKTDYKKTDHIVDPVSYCWSCGYHIPKNHNSLNCNKKKPDHQLGAMCANTMGGSTSFHQWKPK